MDEKYLKFYAMRVNDHDAALFASTDEALEAIEEHIAICDEDTYSIEIVNGIWELISRMGAFENYDDEWMEEVLEVTDFMIKQAKALRDNAISEGGEKQ